MSKRIRVELDIRDDALIGWGGRSVAWSAVEDARIRSVEVVEPQRRTRLTLEHDTDDWAWTEGQVANVTKGRGDNRFGDGWRVVSCEQIESYE